VHELNLPFKMNHTFTINNRSPLDTSRPTAKTHTSQTAVARQHPKLQCQNKSLAGAALKCERLHSKIRLMDSDSQQGFRDHGHTEMPSEMQQRNE